jgi:hypothetical protein
MGGFTFQYVLDSPFWLADKDGEPIKFMTTIREAIRGVTLLEYIYS